MHYCLSEFATCAGFTRKVRSLAILSKMFLQDTAKLKTTNHSYRPTLGTGKTGVEYMYESKLRGSPGREKIEVNATGRPIKVLNDLPPAPGNDVQLSIDIGVQLHASERLRQGRWEQVTLGSHDVQAALASATELQAHLAVGDNMILRDGMAG